MMGQIADYYSQSLDEPPLALYYGMRLEHAEMSLCYGSELDTWQDDHPDPTREAWSSFSRTIYYKGIPCGSVPLPIIPVYELRTGRRVTQRTEWKCISTPLF
eukprot:COSAG04_NODE_125_length_24621_cov_23.574015_6_plen_102_part_00